MPPCRLPLLPLYSLPQYLTFTRPNYWAARLSAFIAAVLPCSMIPDSLQLALVFVVDISTLFSLPMIPNFSLASQSTFFYYSRYHSDLETTLFSHLFTRVNLPSYTSEDCFHWLLPPLCSFFQVQQPCRTFLHYHLADLPFDLYPMPTMLSLVGPSSQHNCDFFQTSLMDNMPPFKTKWWWH